MCKCTANIRTPFCGKPGCEWPSAKPSSARDSLSADQIALAWIDREIADGNEYLESWPKSQPEIEQQANRKQVADTIKAQAAKIAKLEHENKTQRDCLDHYQARFNNITEAWRKGDNDAILDAVRKHITAKDIEVADNLKGKPPEQKQGNAINEAGNAFARRCPKCDGHGKLNDAEPGDTHYHEWVCPKCNGTGLKNDEPHHQKNS